jgi:hypothetical protein
MALPFLPQAVAQFPGNADLTRPLALLGDTIGKAVQDYRRQSLLSDVLRPGANGKVDLDKAALSLLQVDPQLAHAVAGMSQNQFSRGVQQQQLGFEGQRVGISQEQLKIAQEAEKRAAAMDRLKQGILGPMLGGGEPTVAPQAPSLLQPPPSQPPMAPPAYTPGGFNAPLPNIPYQQPQQPPTYVPPQLNAPMAQPAAPGFDQRFSGLPPSQGVPRQELALSMLGYGDAAKLMAENRRNQPANLAMKEFAGATGKNAAEQLQEQPKSLAAAEAAIQSASKAGNEAVRLMTHAGLPAATGPIAGRMPSIREGSANFDADLKTLGTKVFVTAINEMRALSKTGGALGSVTEKEIDKMENSWRAITQIQGPGNLRQNLGKLAEDFNDSMARVARAYELQFGQKLKYEKIQIPQLNRDGTLPKVTASGGAATTLPRYTWAD